ncbi:MAG: hypothetical protein VX346_22300 [Planctomycetota bacterium]|nr:hypothetical protein [Planctomycetota bacterium]
MVQLALSADQGAHFQKPIAIDLEQPVGRPAVAVLEDGSSFLCWLRRADGHTQLRGARVLQGGQVAAQWTIAKVAPGRASGFPRVVADGSQVIVAWTSGRAEQLRVRAVRVSFGN